MKSVIIPTKNEENTIRLLLRELSKADDIETVLVDDSTDHTYIEAKKELNSDRMEASQIRKQREPVYGKGGAMREGVEMSRGNPVVFLDGDIKSFEWYWIDELCNSIEIDDADIVKADYEYEGEDYVTGLVARPLMEEFFPEVDCNRPLEGEMAVKKEVLDEITLRSGFAVESAFVIDAYVNDYDIREAFLGEKVHGERKGDRLVDLAREVQKAILDKAIEYERL